MNAVVTTTPTQRKSVIAEMANRFSVEPEVFEATVRATCMSQNATREEFAAFLLVANEYTLNPLTREIYAFPKRGGGIVPVVSIDGWVNLINSHPAFDGMEFDIIENDARKLVAITCRLYRKDRRLPITVTEYLEECRRQTDPWKMERRMLRHKALIQCARYAFGFSGIYDEDEAASFADLPHRSGQTSAEPPRAPVAIDPPPAPVAIDPPPAPTAPPSPKPEHIETAEFKEVAAKPPAAAGAEASTTVALQSDEVSAIEDNPFDADGMLAELENHCASAQAQKDVDDIRALYADDLERLTRSQKERAEYAFEQAFARIAPKEHATTEDDPPAAPKQGRAKKPEPAVDDLDEIPPPPPAAPATDPFAVPAQFESVEVYREWILVMVQSASTPEHGAAMRAAWKATIPVRNRLDMTTTTIDELKRLVQDKLNKIGG